MIWDIVSPVYDFAETIFNCRVYHSTGRIVADEISPGDTVLECACGTGAISKYIAPACKKLIATDLSKGMRRQTAKKCRKFGNVSVYAADLTHLKCRDARFDAVVAGNVIHLLDDPEAAVRELLRVCKPGGKVIIPTYINGEKAVSRTVIALLRKIGVDFRREFDLESYRAFFRGMGFTNVTYRIAKGRMPCAVAVIPR
ncbi:MAG: class I SAM-dependent methyltransferase [Oscillospiraceae bacterium]|nr:class I SAM-dependent methyltransferase [Oscillospiraceae bacterium]